MRYLILLLALLTVSVQAQQREKIDIWEGTTMPNTRGIEVVDSIANQRVYKVGRPAIYRVAPTPEKNRGIAVVICPGGGYQRYAWEVAGWDIARWLAEEGITGFILTARLPNSPDAVDPSIISTQDLQRALQVIRSRAKEWGIDPEKVGIMGASAGGNLAAQAATQFTSEEDRPDFQVLFYPFIMMSKWHAQSLLMGDTSDEAVDRYWASKQVKENTPPAFLLCSADDRTVRVQNSIEYFQALHAKGIQATLHIYPSGGHGWGYEEWMPYKREWTAELERWLEQWTR